MWHERIIEVGIATSFHHHRKDAWISSIVFKWNVGPGIWLVLKAIPDLAEFIEEEISESGRRMEAIGAYAHGGSPLPMVDCVDVLIRAVGVEIDDGHLAMLFDYLIGQFREGLGVGVEVSIQENGGVERFLTQTRARWGLEVNRAHTYLVHRLPLVGKPFGIDDEPRRSIDEKGGPWPHNMFQGTKRERIGERISRLIQLSFESNIVEHDPVTHIRRNGARRVRDVNEQVRFARSWSDFESFTHNRPASWILRKKSLVSDSFGDSNI